MGFAANYENILSFLLEVPDSKGSRGDYYQLIRRNSETFNTLYSSIERKMESIYDSLKTDNITPKKNTAIHDTENNNNCCSIRLVEPRELLNLLNFIEVYSTRLLYAPRPFFRSNIFTANFLIQMEDTSLVACLFCGKQSAYHRTDGSVCFTTLSATEHKTVHSRFNESMNTVVNIYNVDEAAVGRVLFINDLDPEWQDNLFTPCFPEIEHLHHTFCPVQWLENDRNAVWHQKEVNYTVRGVSKFHHIMQFLTIYPRPRENSSWLCLINRLSKCWTPGATEPTLKNLFRILCHERLTLSVSILRDGWNKRVPDGRENKTPVPPHTVNYNYPRPPTTKASSSSTTSDFYNEPMHVNSYIQDVVNLSDDAEPFSGLEGFQLGELIGSSLPFGGSHTVLPLVEQEMISARANTLKPEKTVVHQNTFIPPNATSDEGPFTIEGILRAFKDGTVTGLNYYRLLYLQGYLAVTTSRGSESKSRTLFSDSNSKPQIQHSKHHVCLYCGAIFSCAGYFYSADYFEPKQLERLISYAILGARGDDTTHQYVYDRYMSPVADFEALFPSDLQAIGRPFETYHMLDKRLKQALMTLSSTLDSLHANFCLFRIRKCCFPSTQCAICLEEYVENEKRSMICGHEFCTSCYNEICMTDCCICKRGYRREPITVSDSVIQGYLERSPKFL